ETPHLPGYHSFDDCSPLPKSISRIQASVVFAPNDHIWPKDSKDSSPTTLPIRFTTLDSILIQTENQWIETRKYHHKERDLTFYASLGLTTLSSPPPFVTHQAEEGELYLHIHYVSVLDETSQYWNFEGGVWVDNRRIPRERERIKALLRNRDRASPS
ncbi:hypothetical protein DXG01_011108, partial [Tephrocybe rancida]